MNNITRFQQPLSLYSLFHADRHAGFESELQIIIVYSYFFKQLLYKTAVNYQDLALLPFYIFQQFPDALLVFRFCVVIHCCLCLKFTQAQNFIGDIMVILTALCTVDQFLLKFSRSR